MPLVLGELTVENLGTIYPRAPYVTEKHIYPIGFVSTRYFSSMINPEQRIKYTSQIIDGGDKPQFIVIAADDESNPIISHSPSGAWRTILKKVMDKSGTSPEDSRKNISVSGTLRFGLAHPVVQSLIRELPNADKLKELAISIAPLTSTSSSESVSPISSRKRKTVTTPSSSDDSGEEEGPIKLHKSVNGPIPLPAPEVKPAPIPARDREEDFFSARSVHFATREEIDDLESAVATLQALKYCAVF